MSGTVDRTWNCNLPALFIVGLALTAALSLHLAQAYTGQFGIPHRSGKYGRAHFATGPASYPRVANDAEGYELKIARPTRKVASQYWSINEYAYSVVPPETVVSVSQSAYDRSYSNVYEWAEKFRPAITTDPEIILKLDPDLLLVSSSGRTDFTDLVRSAGVPTFRMFTMFTTLEEVRQTIAVMGYLSGSDTQAQKTMERFEQAMRRAKARKPANAPAPQILAYAGGYSYGNATLFDDITREIGAVNIGAEKGLRGYGAISTEQIVRWDPEWIVSGAPRGQAATALRRLMEDPAISITTAAHKGQILVFENNVLLPTSPFTTLLLDALGEALFPETANR